MSNAQEVVARNIRSVRTERGLSVTDLAQRAGISRRMLTLMEAGQGNASLATIERVADALGVAFGVLVRDPEVTPLDIVTATEATTMWAGRAGGRGRFFVSSRHRGVAELWDWTLAPGQSYAAEADPDGAEELIIVIDGTLHLHHPAGIVKADASTAIRHASDRPYRYRNPSKEPVRFVRVVVTH